MDYVDSGNWSYMKGSNGQLVFEEVVEAVEAVESFDAGSDRPTCLGKHTGSVHTILLLHIHHFFFLHTNIVDIRHNLPRYHVHRTLVSPVGTKTDTYFPPATAVFNSKFLTIDSYISCTYTCTIFACM